MTDYAYKMNDARLRRLELRLAAEYRTAYKELKKKADDYFIKFKKDDALKRAQVKQGLLSQKDYSDWRFNRMLHTKRYNQMVANAAADLTHVNQIAANMINHELPSVYSLGHNWTGYKISQDLNIRIPWEIYDRNTVERLILEDPALLPFNPKLDIPKDLRWNTQKINSALFQGIVQGESIDKIADRLQKVTNMNRVSAVRNARTAFTGAENAGRQRGYEQAESMGIEMEKMWIATLDNRTRDSHRRLDGETVPVNEEFSNGLMYPGDEDGDPEEVYNCFIGDTRVGANSEVIRTYRHKYKGDLFTVKTAAGIKFTCTPNHPILTDRGWIAANHLDKGDRLLVAEVGEHSFMESRRNPHVNHTLARFDTLHKLFEMFGRKRTCYLGVNFHGDIPTSDVEIVTKKRFLRVGRNARRFKDVYKFPFVLADSFASALRSVLEILGRVTAELACLMGGLCKSDPFRGRCLRHPQIHGLRPIALFDSGFVKAVYDNRPGYAELLRDCLDGFSGMVFADQVVSIDVKFSHCDVFNLQSENGYYFVGSSSINEKSQKSNGIMAIAHNCRCSTISVIKDYPRDLSGRAMGVGVSYEEWKQGRN